MNTDKNHSSERNTSGNSSRKRPAPALGRVPSEQLAEASLIDNEQDINNNIPKFESIVNFSELCSLSNRLKEK